MTSLNSFRDGADLADFLPRLFLLRRSTPIETNGNDVERERERERGESASERGKEREGKRERGKANHDCIETFIHIIIKANED